MFIQSYSRNPFDDRNPSTRQPRSPLRDTHEANILRDKSTSSSDLREPHTRRSSFFSKRPKSAMTTTSNDSSVRSHLSVGGISEVSRRSSTAVDSAILPGESETSRSRFLFGRSRKNKAANMKQVRASSPVDADDESDVRREGLEKQKRDSGRGMRISAPFGFQHGAEVEKRPAEIAEDNTHIFENFRALRKGHRNAIIGPSPESEDMEPSNMRRQKRPPPLRPRRPDEIPQDQLFSPPLPVAQQSLRSTRSVETFIHAATPSMSESFGRTPTGRAPLRSAPLRDDYANYGGFQDPGTPSFAQQPAPTDQWERFISIYDTHPPGSIDMNIPLLHTTSAVDSIQDQFRTPMFNPPLEKVPEEPEGTFSNRQSKDSTQLPSLRHAKSSPAFSEKKFKMKMPTLKDQGVPPVPPLPPMPPIIRVTERPTSQGSDTLGDPLRTSWQQPTSAVKLEDSKSPKGSLAVRENGFTWEDDIDYCYEHAAEADCDFNWQNVSRLDDPDSDSSEAWNELHSSFGSTNNPKREQSQSMASSASSNGDLFHLPNKTYRVPSKDSVPDLEYRSSLSTNTNSLTIATPKDKFMFRSSDPKNIISPQMPQGDVKSDTSHLYDEIVMARTVRSAVPQIPARSEARNDKFRVSELPRQLSDGSRLGMLPTPPPSVDQSPVIPHDEKMGRKDLTVNTIVAQLRGNSNLESPVSPEYPQSPKRNPVAPPPKPSNNRLSDEIPMLKPRSFFGIHNSAKLKLFDAQSKLSSMSPTSMPRSSSNDSVVTQIPISKPPTPPKTPSAEMSSSQPRLNTPSPTSPFPQFEQMFQPPRLPTPLTSTPSQAPAPPQTKIPLPRPECPSVTRQRAGSAAARLGVLPSPSPSSGEGSISSQNRPPSSGRQSYSLFPPTPRKAPKPLDLRPVLGGVSIPAGPRSAGMAGFSTDIRRISPPSFGPRTQSYRPR